MINIKKAGLSDLEIIAELGAQTFRETYSNANSEKDMDEYMSKAFNLQKIKEELSDKNTIFFLATLDSQNIGYAKMSTNRKRKKLKEFKTIELERLYVLKKIIGKGVGKALMEHCLDYAKNHEFEVVYTQVWGEMYYKNLKAIEFYKKWGFEPFDEEIFKLGKSKQKDILMKKELLN